MKGITLTELLKELPEPVSKNDIYLYHISKQLDQLIKLLIKCESPAEMEQRKEEEVIEGQIALSEVIVPKAKRKSTKK